MPRLSAVGISGLQAGEDVKLHSTSLNTSSQRGLRELRKLVKAGLLHERQKRYSSEVCRFELVDKDLEWRLLQQAYEHWCSLGYSTDKIVKAAH